MQSDQYSSTLLVVGVNKRLPFSSSALPQTSLTSIVSPQRGYIFSVVSQSMLEAI